MLSSYSTGLSFSNVSSKSPSEPPSVNLPLNTHLMQTCFKNENFKLKAYTTSLPIDPNIKSTIVLEALKNPLRKLAMKEKIQAFHKNKTWTLVCTLSLFTKFLDIKWVFRMKFHPYGSIPKHKARLAAEGFHQTPSLEFS